MPEGRMLKKVISESKKLGVLPSDSARLLYTWLIPWLDVEGRHSADSEIIKGHVFPKVKSMTIRKIERLVRELNEGRLIILYACDGETYLQFKKTLQKIDPTREAKTTIPDPGKGQIIKPTHANSRVGHENASISKVNESKVKGIKTYVHGEPEKLFENWWKRYPRIEDKGKAKSKWLYLVENEGVGPQQLEDALTGYINVLNNNETPKQYVKHAKSFLYNGNKAKNIPSTWESYIKYADPKYRAKPPL